VAAFLRISWPFRVEYADELQQGIKNRFGALVSSDAAKRETVHIRMP
jgi:hypothetical protein